MTGDMTEQDGAVSAAAAAHVDRVARVMMVFMLITQMSVIDVW